MPKLAFLLKVRVFTHLFAKSASFGILSSFTTYLVKNKIDCKSVVHFKAASVLDQNKHSTTFEHSVSVLNYEFCWRFRYDAH